MQPDSQTPLDPTVLAWTPPPALSEDARPAWAELVAEIPADRLTQANLPVIVAAARLKSLLSRRGADTDIDAHSALVDLLVFLGMTPKARGAVQGSDVYAARVEGEAS